MSESVKGAAAFNLAVGEFAQRLALHDLVVVTLRSEWGTYGSWIVEVKTGATQDLEAAAVAKQDWSAVRSSTTRVVWDGKDGVMSIETNCSSGIMISERWKERAHKRLGSSDDALTFAESWLVKHVAEA